MKNKTDYLKPEPKITLKIALGIKCLLLMGIIAMGCGRKEPAPTTNAFTLQLITKQVARGTAASFEIEMAENTLLKNWEAQWQGKTPQSLKILSTGTDNKGKIDTNTLPVGIQVIEIHVRLNTDSVVTQSLRVVVLAQRPPKIYQYEVVKRYAHDQNNYTQGLIYAKGHLYESTGERGQSKIVIKNGLDGDLLAEQALGSNYFGEGIALYGDSLFQLTWTSHDGFVYDANTLELKRKFRYPTEGWGMSTLSTAEGDTLIVVSDGSARLRFYQPSNWQLIRSLDVYDNTKAIQNLNELEVIDQLIYANIYQTQTIVIIDPQFGEVVGKLDLSNLFDPETYANQTKKRIDVLNGIAYDTKTQHVLVTGKLWPYLYELNLSKTGS